MDLKQLRSFVAIAEAGSLSKASQVVHVVQPALSSHLRSLEEELGAKLFIRTGRGVELSEAGSKLLSHAKFILHRVDLARDELESLSDDVAGVVSVGCLNGLAEAIAPTYVPALKKIHPGIELSFITYSSDELRKSMIESELDMYITYSTVYAIDSSGETIHIEEQLHPGIADVQDICREDLFVCTRSEKSDPAEGIHFSDEAVGFEELSKLPFALPPKNLAVRRMIDWLANRHGVELDVYASTNSIRLTVAWVLEGDCIALLPGVALRRALAREPLIARPLADYTVQRDLVFCSSPSVEKESARAATKAFTVEYLESLAR